MTPAVLRNTSNPIYYPILIYYKLKCIVYYYYYLLFLTVIDNFVQLCQTLIFMQINKVLISGILQCYHVSQS